MPKSNAEYQREYRERKKLEKLNAFPISPAEQAVIGKPSDYDFANSATLPSRKHPAKIVNEMVDEPMFPTDRESGLPRSNYYPVETGGRTWTETIQKIDPHLAQRILDRIAPPRKLR